MDETTELMQKIADYQAKIEQLKVQLARLDDSDTFQRIERVETDREISDYTQRIARLERRLCGEPEPGMPTDEQIRHSDWVLSDDYDNE
jgi:predicted RNase H-like nuclease (RuvC/YqgF family)